MTKHYLIFIHGMGETNGVEESYNQLIEKIGYEYKKDDFGCKFKAIKVNWHDLDESQLSKAQLELFETAFPKFAHKRLSARKFFTTFLGDIVAYVSEDVQVIRRIVWKQIWEQLEQPLTEENCVYSIISHSLGTVIAFDYLFNLFNKNELFLKEDKGQKLPLGKLRDNFRHFFTFGSPIGLFMLRKDYLWNQGEPFEKLLNPIKGQHREWLNMYDVDDFIAYPLKELFEKNSENLNSKLIDRKVRTGWTTIDSHINYWKNQEVAELIAEVLSNEKNTFL
jgi:hypothetical protein